MPVPCKREVLSPTKIRATTGGIVTPPNPSKTAPSLRLALNLPPLSKGGGLTALHKLLLCCFLLAICPLILYCKLFCRQDGGIATPSNLFKTALSLASHHHPCLMNALFVLRPAKLRAFNFGHPCPSLVKGRCCRPQKFGRLPEGLLPLRTTPFQNRTIPLTFRNANVCLYFLVSHPHYPIRFS